MTSAPLPSLDSLALSVNRWERLASGRWWHPDHVQDGRRKLYTEAAALAELAATLNPAPPSAWGKLNG